jgi:(p)ppGpp synthase/HD superfamily hydrolase
MIQTQNTMSITELAESIARSAHDGQFRRDGVTPYITHPEAVAFRLRMEQPKVVAAAWLHDVLEDTDESCLSLATAGVPNEIILAVDALTKTEGISYDDYLDGVRANWIARKVKVADMLHNLSSNPTDRQILKYARGLVKLLS